MVLNKKLKIKPHRSNFPNPPPNASCARVFSPPASPDSPPRAAAALRAHAGILAPSPMLRLASSHPSPRNPRQVGRWEGHQHHPSLSRRCCSSVQLCVQEGDGVSSSGGESSSTGSEETKGVAVGMGVGELQASTLRRQLCVAAAV
ncbi:hypothetical protein BS78_07G098300 [Paspalum vaginatum]|nr:hypothetical protein BS78_07G098300 [Paspalum vaginatum]KAJ1267951.1 hypothetical protein BS78_07G098300 [Paspalum vaginatum]KAJ1267952.1 hypothetical protein BS78_07G098300 [Paspalum vaginatum]